ncbi:MAG: hypothetical protein MZW92_09755 [Comamonadaceae bacterium]|nr:hypothetical protein [Comamonadaceae bacterium]
MAALTNTVIKTRNGGHPRRPAPAPPDAGSRGSGVLAAGDAALAAS